MEKEDITVHVRSPTLETTLTIKIPLDADIATLKKYIKSTHPTHPPTSHQRIIYGGKILENVDTLEATLKNVEHDFIPTFHLVVKPTTSVTTQPTQRASRTTTTTTPLPPQQPTTQPHIESREQSQQQHISSLPLLPGGYQVVAINGQYYLAPVLVPSAPFPPLYQPQQSQEPVSQQSWQPQPWQPQQPQQPQVNPIIQPNAIPQQRQPIMNGVNGLLRQMNNIQRTTSIWLAFRLVIVLFITCQGASVGHMIVYHILAFIFFLYQTGRLRTVLDHLSQWQPRAAPQTGPLTTFDVVKRFTFAFFASLWPTYGIDPRIAQAFENENNE